MTRPTRTSTERLSTAMDLLAQLVGALELREASDPDNPAWAAEWEIQRLEHDIVVCLRDEPWPYDVDASALAPRHADRGVRSVPRIRAVGMVHG